MKLRVNTYMEQNTVLSIRPNVASLGFHVFARSIHPELFQIYRSHKIERSKYTARIDITREGHIVQFTSQASTISEVACGAQQPLPQKRYLCGNKIAGTKRRSIDDRQGLMYETEYSLETVGPDLFVMVQQQLGHELKENDLLQIFDSSGRLALGALSFIHLEARSKSLIIQALHTFPDDQAIVKSFTTISLTK